MVADQRERNAELLGRLQAYGISLKLETLDVGDYVISERLCLERKTVYDFESSIIDGRLFDQLNRMKKAYEFPLLVLEGSREEFRMEHSVINGAIVAIYLNYGVPVITSFGPSDTADIIRAIALQEQRGAREPSPKSGKRAFTEPQFMERVVGNIPGVGPKLSRLLLSNFKSIKAIANAEVKDLMKVDGVGKKKAESIHNVLTKLYADSEKP
ncbi:MAG: helix-hairpin-helix domain-containing protein [Candidatus Marsarchaeota archaeon]|nr:helix-hairpin-helix domain-containing protein [Candidatus Marsarchaeota archaeon]